MWKELILVCYFISLFIPLEGLRTLDEYVKHYEKLNYDTTPLSEHHRSRRSTQSATVNLKFSAFGREFRLFLQPDSSVFSSRHVLEFNGKLFKEKPSFIYTGSLSDIPGSRVDGAIINGTFRGEIHIPDDTTYHIEPSDRYFRSAQGFHSVMYDESHMDMDPFRARREAEQNAGGACGMDYAQGWMAKVANSAKTDRNKREDITVNSHDNHDKYSRDANMGGESARSRRATPTCTTLEKNTCSLYLRSDPQLIDYFMDNANGLGYDEERSRQEIVELFANHVKALNQIYTNTQFTHGAICYQGVSFVVHRTKVMTRDSEKCGTTQQTAYCNKNIDVSNFLNLNSQADHHEYCLAYVITYRDFSKGTLGLAWVGSADKARGGICENHDTYQEGKREVSKSLNTGVITLVNYAKKLPPRVTQLTFAHEVGHNFGSPHDDGDRCAPFGTSQSNADDGNFIMFASATDGTKSNNNKFSVCSKQNISRVIHSVLSKKMCFERADQAFCGNGIVEEGEQCDCGFASDCEALRDTCCHPRGTLSGTPCELKTPGSCSPSQGPCCDATTCSFITANDHMCKAATECSAETVCNPLMRSAACPQADRRPNGTFCQDKSMVCQSGVCQGSLCTRLGQSWGECFIQASETDPDFRQKLCYLACQSTGGACMSSNDETTVNDNANFRDLLLNVSKTGNPDPIKLPAGSPCNNFKGYCDVFHRCRGVDAEGPLARLKNLIFNPQTLETIKDWIQVHWWAVLLMSLGLVLFMGVFIKICAVHTPSSNPRKAPARKLTLPTTLQRRRARERAQGQRQQQQPQPQQQYPMGEGVSRYSSPSTSYAGPTASSSQEPPPPYEYPGRPAGGPPPGGRVPKPKQHRGAGYQGYNMEVHKV